MPDNAARPTREAKGDAHGSVVSFPRAREPEQHPPENNLPVELSSFVGREREIAEVGKLLWWITAC